MRKDNIAKISVYSILIFSIILFSTAAYAQTDAPILPAFFYGKASVNGRDVPVSSEVIARINGEIRGKITITAAGEYGSEVSDNKLAVVGSRSDIGKNIEFYVKIPGIQEIKAEQVFQWQSSSVNNLNLTFRGEEVMEPLPPSPGGGGGGGGGAGGGVFAATTQAQVGAQSGAGSPFYYNLIEAGKQLSISLANGVLIKLQLILNSNVEEVNFEFDVLDSVSVPVLEGAYKYISINAPKITDNDVKTAIIKFKVANSWFEENNYDPKKVKLLRYQEGWNELETVHEGSDSTHNYYRSGTPGFSYFAIKSEEPEKTAAREEESEDRDLSGITSEITGAVIGAAAGAAANPIIGFAIIFVIILVGVSIYFFVTKGKKYN